MKLLVIVPYRDRESHLKEFIPYITKTLQDQNVSNKIVVVEQSAEKLFNRGLLCNIGYHLHQNECDYICIHDVDIIGENFDYRYEATVTHLSARCRNRNYKEFYPKCLGGVVLFPKEDFLKINGFSNEYWGWGAEDDDLRLRCDVIGYKVQRKKCRYYTLDHDTMQHSDRLKNSPGYSNNLEKLKKFRESTDKEQMIKDDGLSNLDQKYSLLETIDYREYTLIKVKL